MPNAMHVGFQCRASAAMSNKTTKTVGRVRIDHPGRAANPQKSHQAVAMRIGEFDGSDFSILQLVPILAIGS